MSAKGCLLLAGIGKRQSARPRPLAITIAVPNGEAWKP
jgi:hypothetical protein